VVLKNRQDVLRQWHQSCTLSVWFKRETNCKQLVQKVELSSYFMSNKS